MHPNKQRANALKNVLSVALCNAAFYVMALPSPKDKPEPQKSTNGSKLDPFSIIQFEAKQEMKSIHEGIQGGGLVDEKVAGGTAPLSEWGFKRRRFRFSKGPGWQGAGKYPSLSDPF